MAARLLKWILANDVPIREALANILGCPIGRIITSAEVITAGREVKGTSGTLYLRSHCDAREPLADRTHLDVKARGTRSIRGTPAGSKKLSLCKNGKLFVYTYNNQDSWSRRQAILNSHSQLTRKENINWSKQLKLSIRWNAVGVTWSPHDPLICTHILQHTNRVKNIYRCTILRWCIYAVWFYQ